MNAPTAVRAAKRAARAKKDLEMLAGISHYMMSKMSRDENVTTEVLGKVCMALDCKVEDMVEFIPEK